MAETPPMPRGEELTTHGRFLRSLARSLVAPAEQEDLVQETWTRALEQPPRHEGALKAWLARILRRTAHSRGAREAERVEREATAFHARPAATSDDPAAITAELELSRRVLEAVERLREPYRSTLYLRYYRGHSPERIAADSATPVKTVKTRLARGLEELRGELDRLHGGERRAWVVLLLPLARALPPAPTESVPPLRFAPLGFAAGGLLLVAGSAAVYFHSRSADERGAQVPAATDSRPDWTSSEPSSAPSAARARRESVDAPPVPSVPRDERVRLHGRVLEARGEGLAEVEVRVTALGHESRGPRGLRAEQDDGEVAAVVTDAAGEFELWLAEPGPIRVGCELDGFAPLGRRLLVFAGQELDLGVFVLESGVTLAGRVVDEDGQALAGAELWQPRRDEGLSFGPEERWFRVATSDARGEFTLARLAGGEWRLEARAAEYLTAGAHGVLTHAEEVQAPLEFVLRHGSALEGTVVGLAPEELARARVVARPLGEGTGEPRAVVPAVDGSFRFAGLASEAELELVLVQGEGRELRRGGGLRARAGERGLVLVARAEERRSAALPEEEVLLTERGALEVAVTLADGAPAPGALVLLAPSGRGRGAYDVRAADREGRVFFEDLAPGPHELASVSGVFDPELESAAGTLAVSVVAGETTRAELRALSLGRLVGEVRVQGEALAGAEIRVRPLESGATRRGPPATLLVRSADDGRFLVASLPPGNYALELAHARLATTHARNFAVRAGDNELLLALTTGEFSARVRAADGGPLAGVRVHSAAEEPFGPPRARAWLATSDGQGQFVLSGLELDAAPALTLEAKGYATLLVPRVEAGSTAEFRLEREAALAVEVRGGGASWLRLVATGPGGVRRVFGLAPGARTPLDGLCAGAWSFALFAPERAQRSAAPLAERSLELTVGQASELVFELP